jgi:hypothetical protein
MLEKVTKVWKNILKRQRKLNKNTIIFKKCGMKNYITY